jgi:ureidoacrylate peracid hydrolase
MHIVSLPQWALEYGKVRGGFDSIEPSRTALLVVDLQNLFIAPGQPLANPHALDVVPQVNAIARSVRRGGGTVVFLRHTVSDEPRFRLTEWQARMVPRNASGEFELRDGSFGHQLYDELEVEPRDLVVNKHRYSAFLPNSSDLDAMLRERGIDTLIITGTITNVCCESTARDGNDEEHNATLLSMAAVFAEVRPTASVLGMF